ncbi:DNA-protecting protein DprA [Paenibacillus albicereus]|uniref:DNA-protecting protein DprA n=2 Tax=Paenibacillus albicereus TaxID=2726185 RepID=A0A6H2H4S6_9BACL|nr:DNA-protecting protein DprA [Paenibacillus albicereus]
MDEWLEQQWTDAELERMREFVISMHETPGIGWQSLYRAMQAELWREPELATAQLARLGIRQAPAAEAARRWRERHVPIGEGALQGLLGRRMTILDAEYPPLLQRIPQPPWVLYAVGRMELLERPCLAVVGTRGPTAYGRQAAAKLSRELAAAGFAIVSGMARGIDGLSHEAALDAGGATIAVLGTPVDTAYPPDNRALYRRLCREGLVLSEFPIGTPVKPGMFPQRNRIIAGLSLGTIVIEAAAASGSLITADQALDMNREVFAVPGPIHSPKSIGCNALIRDGRAKLADSSETIARDFSHLQPAKPQASALPEEPQLSADEQFIYMLLRDEPRSADELFEASGLAFGLLQTVLINLCLKRKIELHHGSIYMAL